MSELAFTLARFGFLALLWVLVLLVLRTLRRDVAPGSPRSLSLRRSGEKTTSKPAARSRRRQASRLVITEGPLAGSTVPLSPTSITIGRSPSCTLVLEDSYASSRHARIFPKDGTWWLEDLGSTNGTTLAGQSVTGTAELSVGVPVRIGQTTLELRP
ncbi:MAG: FHA domain-containing protein [Actinomyces urogenitalis]|uniref:FHA domain protein n=3 Tax=Actinomyces urogenitalis TaxID=103621 RepID=C0W4Q9_9ACTO|nr:FHA domain-containing protein [Actinomyces urogenitalis]ETJ01700.1 MAG: FHA protein [Actinomyces urogenitalis DORA_12]EEH66284.1 FHA domain protein [Actinomyces urogenitalis DSM 15434]KGF04443.1 signal peptide protein [Actinomyces urogenitalis S6-C4]KGF04497.1 signal peptide protein [Actinomyces urogenitalis S6-C4]MBS5977880.1 FHA domain-containing protein [Actinomyces urogenitalis]